MTAARRRRASITGIAALVLAATVSFTAPAGAAPGAGSATETAPRRSGAAHRPKAPTARPSRSPVASATPVSRHVDGPRASTAELLAPAPSGALAAAAAVADTTPPSAPAGLVATAQSTTGISASWSPSVDAESGISSYVFAIGTVNAGTPTQLANARWWQVTYASNISVNLSLDPNLTYYVSVQASNGVGLVSPIVTSNGVRGAWTPLGQPSNVLQLRFASSGVDTAGNAIAGWTAAQQSQMTSFFDRMSPILRAVYGPPADSYTVNVVRDLRYSRSNVFIPSLDEIHMDDSFSPQLFTHELVHAFRNDRLLSSDQNWNFNSTLSPFEEAFAQAVSYEAMNDYVAAHPNDTIVSGTSLWGSGNDWDYDFQNVPELRGTDLWSEDGGTGLHWLKYEMGAAALRKVELESPDFYRRFNAEYYARINANPSSVRPTRALVVDIVRSVVPVIEGMPAADWIDRQHVFYAQNVYGKKIFHRVQDYPATELFAFHDLYFLETMACGSEWACFDGQRWNYHRLNGAAGSGRLVDSTGSTVWSGALRIEPTQNPSDGYFGFGYDRKSLTTATTLQPWPGGSTDDYIMNLRTLGLYRFESTFLDPATQAPTTNSIYRVMGAELTGGFTGVWGGVLGRTTGTLSLQHEGYAPEAPIPVVNGAFKATRTWTGVANPRTGGRDSVPGRVFATFVDAQTGRTYEAQRNIDYGSVNGNQMFLFDFTGPGRDTTAPTVALTAPNTGSTSATSVTIAATATDNVGVTKVELLVDGTVIATDASAPYSGTWNTAGSSLGAHAVTARASDAAGNITLSAPVTVTLTDTTAPALTITRPTNNSTVSRSTAITIAATATDARGIARVQFYVNNTLRCTDTSSAYTCAWPVPSARNVRYTIRVRATDTTGNSRERTVSVTSR